MTSTMVDSIKAIGTLEELELNSKINKKVSELVDDIDLTDIQNDPMFKKMLCAAFAAKAAGTAFNGTV